MSWISSTFQMKRTKRHCTTIIPSESSQKKENIATIQQLSQIDLGKIPIQGYQNLEVSNPYISSSHDSISLTCDLQVEQNSEYPNLPESLRYLTNAELKTLEEKTRKKVDMRIIPMVSFIYMLNFLDRTNIGTARLGGLEDDLGITSTQYQTVISLLFVGYVLMQVPCNLYFNKFGKPSILIPLIMFLWGSVSTCTGAVQTYGQLIAVRFLLGWLEAGFFCGCLFYLSCWYTRKELTVRNSILYSGSLVAGAFSGLIGAGIINNMDNVRNLRAWRWLFIIEGSITCAIVPFSWLVLPDFPSNTKFLSQQEKDIIIWKLKNEVGQDDSDLITEIPLKIVFQLIIKDLKAWLILGVITFNKAAEGGLTNFFPTLIQTLGYSPMKTLAMTSPPFLIAVILSFIWSLHADKMDERFWHYSLPSMIAIIAFIITISTVNVGARYFAFCIMIPGVFAGYASAISWVSNIIPRPPMKRAITIALVISISNSTSIGTSYLYNTSDSPRYIPAFCACIAFIAMSIVMAAILKYKLIQYNKRIVSGTMDWEKDFGKGNSTKAIASDFRFVY